MSRAGGPKICCAEITDRALMHTHVPVHEPRAPSVAAAPLSVALALQADHSLLRTLHIQHRRKTERRISRAPKRPIGNFRMTQPRDQATARQSVAARPAMACGKATMAAWRAGNRDRGIPDPQARRFARSNSCLRCLGAPPRAGMLASWMNMSGGRSWTRPRRTRCA